MPKRKTPSLRLSIQKATAKRRAAGAATLGNTIRARKTLKAFIPNAQSKHGQQVIESKQSGVKSYQLRIEYHINKLLTCMAQIVTFAKQQ
jgi:hypothetical protein